MILLKTPHKSALLVIMLDYFACYLQREACKNSFFQNVARAQHVFLDTLAKEESYSINYNTGGTCSIMT